MIEETYTGWKKWTPKADEWIEFEADGKLPFKLLENEYLLVYDDKEKLTCQYIMKSGKVRRIGRSNIKVERDQDIQVEVVEEKSKKSKKSTPQIKYSKGKNLTINPRNDEQVCAIDMLKDDDIKIKLLEGSFGTGKTMLMVNAALEALKYGKFEKIIWIRNNVDCYGTKDLGALPGSLLEKNFCWLGPILDHAGEDSVNTMLEKGTLKVEPLQFLRGRNFENSLIICTEAENLLLSSIQLIVSRAASGTEVWFDGDYRQADKKMFVDSNGLQIMKNTFKGNPLFGCVTLVKSERSKTAAMADLLDPYVMEQKSKIFK